jgi:hypothetical protein
LQFRESFRGHSLFRPAWSCRMHPLMTPPKQIPIEDANLVSDNSSKAVVWMRCWEMEKVSVDWYIASGDPFHWMTVARNSSRVYPLEIKNESETPLRNTPWRYVQTKTIHGSVSLLSARRTRQRLHQLAHWHILRPCRKIPFSSIQRHVHIFYQSIPRHCSKRELSRRNLNAWVSQVRLVFWMTRFGTVEIALLYCEGWWELGSVWKSHLSNLYMRRENQKSWSVVSTLVPKVRSRTSRVVGQWNWESGVGRKLVFGEAGKPVVLVIAICPRSLRVRKRCFLSFLQWTAASETPWFLGCLRLGRPTEPQLPKMVQRSHLGHSTLQKSDENNIGKKTKKANDIFETTITKAFGKQEVLHQKASYASGCRWKSA